MSTSLLSPLSSLPVPALPAAARGVCAGALFALIALAIGPSESRAATCVFDAAKDLSENELDPAGPRNPNGPWSYGFQANLFGPMTLMSAGCGGDHLDAWYTRPEVQGYMRDMGGQVPMVVVNTTASKVFFPFGGWVDGGEIVVHTGPTGGPGQFNIIRFRAPVTGSYAIDAGWKRNHAAGITWYVLRGTSVVASGPTTNTSTYTGFVGTVSASAGETIDFVIHAPFGYGATTTGFHGSVSYSGAACVASGSETCLDVDGNGTCDEATLFPNVPDPLDPDGDGICSNGACIDLDKDGCDNSPDDLCAGDDSLGDPDGDGICGGAAAAPDEDGDGIPDDEDPCPSIPDASTCLLDGECLGEGDTACAGESNLLTCQGGQLVETSCGADACDDTGGSEGGGACQAVDFSCSGGACQASATSGTDTCGGTADAPSVTFYSCQGGNLCVASTTTEHDSCSETGGAYGGGSCSATDWSCGGGVLSSTSSSGVDTCGDGGEAQVDHYTCTSADAAGDDTCTPVPDTATPDLTCPEEIVVECTRVEGVHVGGVEAGAGDVCDDSVDVENTWTAGGTDASGDYPIGVTEVTFTATDDAGNVSTCTTIVEVLWTPWSLAVYSNTTTPGLGIDHDVVITGDVLSNAKSQLLHDSVVEGAVFSRGDVQTQAGTTIDGGLYTDGSSTPPGDHPIAGAVPSNAPAPPSFSDAYYATWLAQAASAPKQSGPPKSYLLGGGVVLVGGNATVKAGGSVTGPGTLVATGNIELLNGATVGPDVTLIAGGQLQSHGASVSSGALLYAAKDLFLHAGTTFAGGHILSKGTAFVQASTSVTGLVFAVQKIHVDHHATVIGSLVSLGRVDIKHDVTVVHDCEASETLPPGLDW